MEVVKETKKEVNQNLNEINNALKEAKNHLELKMFKEAYHYLDMASIGIAVEKINLIKKDSKDEKSN